MRAWRDRSVTISYTYSSGDPDPDLNHNLLTKTDGRGDLVLTVHYDSSDRVTKEDLAGGDTYARGVGSGL